MFKHFRPFQRASLALLLLATLTAASATAAPYVVRMPAGGSPLSPSPSTPGGPEEPGETNPPAQLQLAPSALDLGGFSYYDTADKTRLVSLTNASTSSALLAGVSVSDGPFVVTQDGCAGRLEAGASCGLTVRYTGGPGAGEGTLLAVEANGRQIEVPVRARATAPVLAMDASSVIGGTSHYSVSKPVIVRNDGDEPATVRTAATGWTLSQSEFNLQPGESQTVNVSPSLNSEYTTNFEMTASTVGISAPSATVSGSVSVQPYYSSDMFSGSFALFPHTTKLTHSFSAPLRVVSWSSLSGSPQWDVRLEVQGTVVSQGKSGGVVTPVNLHWMPGTTLTFIQDIFTLGGGGHVRIELSNGQTVVWTGPEFGAGSTVME